MPSPPERSAARIVAHGFLAVLLILAAIPAYLGLSPSWRPVAARAACALLVVAGCMRVVRAVRGSIGPPAPSPLDAPPAPSPPPELDDRFLRLRDDLVYGERSRRYFDAILWPRLLELAGTPLPRPAARRRLRRVGPSLRALERLVTLAEKRP
jgi:hypothetical protein